MHLKTADLCKLVWSWGWDRIKAYQGAKVCNLSARGSMSCIQTVLTLSGKVAAKSVTCMNKSTNNLS